MKSSVKQFLSLVVAILLIIPLIPSAAYADGGAEYYWPVPTCTYITSHCGEDGHKGIDIATYAENTVVVASRSGVVSEADSTACTHINNYPNDTCNYGKGNYIKIVHDDGSYATYMHLKYGSLTVKAGDRVNAGDKLGIMGSSGLSTGQHLHFQLNAKDGTLINNNPDVFDYIYPDNDEFPDGDELWLCDADIGLNVRKGAGTSFAKLGTMSYKTLFTVSEKIEADGYTWGKISYASGFPGFTGGWCVLDFAILQKSPNPDTDTDIAIDTDTEQDSDTAADIDTDITSDFDTLPPDDTDSQVETDSDAEKADPNGDFNGDGAVSVLDVVEMRSAIANGTEVTAEQILRADLNGDGAISVVDVVMLRGLII